MRLINLIALCLLFVLTSKAQYTKLVKGERNPYDTAVAIDIKRYRAETAYIKQSRQLIDSLNAEIRLLEIQISQYDTANQSLHTLVARKDAMIKRKDELIESFSKEYKVIYNSWNEFYDKQKLTNKITLGGIALAIILILAK